MPGYVDYAAANHSKGPAAKSGLISCRVSPIAVVHRVPRHQWQPGGLRYHWSLAWALKRQTMFSRVAISQSSNVSRVDFGLAPWIHCCCRANKRGTDFINRLVSDFNHWLAACHEGFPLFSRDIHAPSTIGIHGAKPRDNLIS